MRPGRPSRGGRMDLRASLSRTSRGLHRSRRWQAGGLIPPERVALARDLACAKRSRTLQLSRQCLIVERPTGGRTMQLGFVSAILPDLTLDEVLAFAADEGFG